MIRAEVKKISAQQINVLVKGCGRESCEFGEDLVVDLYNVIRRYRVFQDEKTQPLIKISYVDNKGRSDSCELSVFLEDSKRLEKLVDPKKLTPLKETAQSIGGRLNFRFAIKVPFVDIEFGMGAKPDKKSGDTTAV